MAATALSSRERYLTAFRHQEPDRVPIHLELPAPMFFPPRVHFYNQLDRAELLLELGCDPMITLWLPDPVPHPDVEVRVWREKADDGKIYIGKEFHTPAGVLREVVEETPDWCDAGHGFWVRRTLGTWLKEDFNIDVFDDWAVSRRTEPWVKGPEDLPKLRYVLQKPPQWQLDEWRFDAQRALEFADKHQLLSMVRRTILHDAGAWFCDLPWFMLQLYDDPEMIREFLAIFEEAAVWQMDLALSLKPDVMQHRGWYDGPDFWGGVHFDTYIKPLLDRFADVTHQADVLHCYLLTEGWGPYLDRLRALETDMVWGADPFLSRASMQTIKETVGAAKAVIGGISTEQHLIACPVETTRQATRDAIAALAPGGGFVLASSSFIGRESSWENIAAMVEEAQRVGRYPLG